MRNSFKLILASQIIYSVFGHHKLRGESSIGNPSPFFILGSGRNGSTLLSMILNGHPKLIIPPEQYALHFAAIRFKLYNFLMWKDLVKVVIGEFADNNNNEDWNINFNGLYSKLYSLSERERSFQIIIDKIIAEYAIQSGKDYKFWGDKTPSTIWYLQTIFDVYPRSKYIFLIRDGRDVVSSYKTGGRDIFGDLAKVENAAINWRESIAKWKWLKKRANSEQLLEVRYENLIENPEQIIEEMTSFLNVSYENNILDFNKVALKREEINRKQYWKLKNPLNNSPIGQWKDNLTNTDISKILPILEDGLKEYRYL